MRLNYQRLGLFASLKASFATVKSTNTETKLCKNCKYIIPDKSYQHADPLRLRFAKCEEYPTVEEDASFFITGVSKPKIIDYSYCTTARKMSFKCGPEGSKFVADDEDKDKFW